MRLLVINYEMNPSSKVLAWQYHVVLGLASRCDFVLVITEAVGECELPFNVRCIKLPLVLKKVPFRWLGLRWLLNILLPFFILRYGIRACFVHMNMEWTYRLAPVMKLMRIPVVLWYAHGTVTQRLRWAIRSADRVVTSTPEGCRVESSKIHVIGQGIPLHLFPIRSERTERSDIVSVSRVSRRKGLEIVIAAFHAFARREDCGSSQLIIVGDVLTRDDKSYLKELRQLLAAMQLSERVTFVGYVPLSRMAAVYERAALQVNMSDTGSMDKTVLEALAVGCPVLTSNEAFRAVLGRTYPEFLLETRDAASLCARMATLYKARLRYDSHALRSIVAGHHDLDRYCDRVLEQLQELTGHKSTEPNAL